MNTELTNEEINAQVEDLTLLRIETWEQEVPREEDFDRLCFDLEDEEKEAAYAE